VTPEPRLSACPGVYTCPAEGQLGYKFHTLPQPTGVRVHLSICASRVGAVLGWRRQTSPGLSESSPPPLSDLSTGGREREREKEREAHSQEQAPNFSAHSAPAPRRVCRGMRVCVHERVCVCVCEPDRKGTPAQRMCFGDVDRFSRAADCRLVWLTLLCACVLTSGTTSLPSTTGATPLGDTRRGLLRSRAMRSHSLFFSLWQFLHRQATSATSSHSHR